MKRMKILVILMLFSGVANASIPVKDENGCTIGSRGAEEGPYGDILKENGIKENRVATIPWYLKLGDKDSSVFITHPYNHPEINCPPIKHSRVEILLPFTDKLVGHLEQTFSDVFITVPTPDEVKYFPTKDVFVQSTQKWDFKEFRKEK